MRMFLRESLVLLVVSGLSLTALLFLSRQVMAGSPSPLYLIEWRKETYR